MKTIPIEELADAVLRALAARRAEAVADLPDTRAASALAAALIVEARSGEPTLKPILVTDFYRDPP